MKATLPSLLVFIFLLTFSCKKKEVINLPPTANAGTDATASLGISKSSEGGIAQYRGTLLLDTPDSNTYSNNAKGNIVTQ